MVKLEMPVTTVSFGRYGWARVVLVILRIYLRIYLRLFGDLEC